MPRNGVPLRGKVFSGLEDPPAVVLVVALRDTSLTRREHLVEVLALKLGTRNNHDFGDVMGRIAWIAARGAT